MCKLIPDKIPDKKLNLPNAIEYVPELRAAEASPDERVRDTLKYAQMLEGNVRNTGVHACGTIICRDDITDWVPVSTAEDKETGEKMLVTQYEGSVIEDTGLIKMDFLGLKTLSIIKEAVANVKLHRGIDLDIDTIPIDDPAARASAQHLRGPHRHERPLPAGAYGLHPRLHRPQVGTQAHRV